MRLTNLLTLIALLSPAVSAYAQAPGGASMVASDNFTRSNASTLGSNWTVVQGTWSIGSNTGYLSSPPGNSNPVYWNANSFGTDQYVCVKRASWDSGTRFRAAVRIPSGTKSGYGAYCSVYGSSCTSLVLAKSSADTVTTLQTISGLNIGASDEVCVTAQGTSTTTIKVWVDGAQVGTTQTDSSSPITSGSPGMMGYSSMSSTNGATYWEGGSFSPTTATPSISPNGGTFTSSQSVTITDSTGGAVICYTTDGSTPTGNGAGTCTHGTTYSGAITVSSSETVKAIGTTSGFSDSSAASAVFTVNVMYNPTFSPAAGEYQNAQSVTISDSTPGVTICYTTDGSTPTTNGSGTCTHGTTYAGAFSVSTYETVKAVASESGYTDSSVVSALYNFLTTSAVTFPAAELGYSYQPTSPFPQTTLTALNGAPPYTWTINGGGTLSAQGAACAGLSLSTSGVVSGTPTTTGTCSFTALVTDSASITATVSEGVSVASLTFTAQPSVAWTSPSSIAASFTTAVPASVVEKCGAASGGPYTTEVTPSLYTQGYQRQDFTGTSANWGHAVAIPGLHQNTTYYCKVTATSVNSSVLDSSEFSATTGTLSTVPISVPGVSEFTRVNDGYHGLNGMPSNGGTFWIDGDTEYSTWADNGEVYGTSHDGGGVNPINPTVNADGWQELWFHWNAAHTSASQIGTLGFGPEAGPATAGTAANSTDCSGDQWESWGIQSVNGAIYFPVWCNRTGSNAHYNILKSTDHLQHSINANNAYGNGPGAATASYADVPTTGMTMPGLSTQSDIPFVGLIDIGCKDQTFGCVPQANDDAYVYGNAVCLTRIRREDLPLLDGSKWQYYTGSRSGDDGLYDSAWSSSSGSCTGFPDFNFASPAVTFIPDFNRWMLVNDPRNDAGYGAFLEDMGPYPWGQPTRIGAISWSSKTWPTYTPAFGQVLPNSYVRVSSSPLSSRIIVSTTGTTDMITSSPDTDHYSPFLGEVNLVARDPAPAPGRVSPANLRSAHVLNGLDIYYDFKGVSGDSTIANKSPNDPTGVWNAAAPLMTNLSGTVTSANMALYNQRGAINFGYVLGSHTNSNVQTITSYSKTLSAFTLLLAYDQVPSSCGPSGWGSTVNNETLLHSNQITLQRNGTTANSWEAVVGSTIVGPVTITDGNFAVLALRYDGSHLQLFRSSDVEPNAALPLTPAASAAQTGSVSVGSSYYLGASNSSGANNFCGVLSDHLMYSRALSDAELQREFNAIRSDMAGRGVSIP